MFRIARFYFRLMSNADRTGDVESLAGWCLAFKKSYRLSSDIRAPAILGACWRALRRIWSTTKVHHIEGGNSDYLIWDNRNVKDIRVDHIRSNQGVLPATFVARDEITITGFRARMSASFTLKCFFFKLLFRAFSGKNIGNTLLLPSEWIEAAALLQIVVQKGIRHVYFYCPYEIDSNAIYLLLKELGVKVNKIPSPNLLAIANSDLLSDELTLTSPCQLDELRQFSSLMKYQTILKWLPEQFYRYGHLYENRSPAPGKTIGYYSHGSWMRNKNTGETDLGDVDAELALLPVLGRFLDKHKDFSCTVFLHPKEKKADLEEVTKYYNVQLGAGRYVFGDLKESGASMFDTVDIGVGALSTILFERLFLGNKTIFYPVGIPIFPSQGSHISSICANNEIELEQLILQSASMSSSGFRKQFNLDEYTIHEWIPGAKYGRQD